MPSSTKAATRPKAPRSAKRSIADLAAKGDALAAARSGRTGTVDRSDRREVGRALRKDVPRAAHAEWQPAADRADPVALLRAQGETRVAELLPIRYGRMVESPFGFFRGAAVVMATDLAGSPSTGLQVQVCGDGHLVNFGAFGTPERRLIFDVNDFDETLPGPWEWDIKRLAASFVVAARAKSFTADDATNAVQRVALSYAATLSRLASLPTLAAWYWSIDAEGAKELFVSTADAETMRRTDRAIARAHSRDMLQAVDKLTEVVDGQRRIVDQLPLLGHVPGEDELSRMHALYESYRASVSDELNHLLDRFRLVDAARKVVGVGSVGTRCWIALLDGGADDDPLLLQVKEAEASVLERHLGASAYDNHGRRVVEGQRLMQAASDIFLGWTRDEGSGRDYYWRQLRDMKWSPDVAGQPLGTFLTYAELCGVTLARAHARSGDAAAIAGYLGKGNDFGNALARFATAYADQNERDHAALRQAVDDGVVPAETGV